MAMHKPAHPGEFIFEVYLEPNNRSGRELVAKLGVAASTLNRILTGGQWYQPGDGITAFQGAGPLARELACDAVQLRSLASEAACETRQCPQSQAHGSLTSACKRRTRDPHSCAPEAQR
jgi:hypothetical protein